MSWLAELKRRNVIRIAGLYAVTAWLMLQVAETVLPIFHTPDWVLQALVVMLAIGFLPALVIAWAFELTPEGLQRDAGAALSDSVEADPSVAEKGRRVDRAIIVLLSLAIVYFATDKFMVAPHRDGDGGQVAANGAFDASRPSVSAGQTAGSVPSEPGKSIAVLPFVNMSQDPENEFFSDGLSEEILNSLARIDSLRVVGRTSSFQFKGQNEDLRVVGEKLGVSHVLEGSVRRADDRVRITAQLVRTSDGIHLWSQTYDRTLDDIFAVQLDIAEQAAEVLEVVLSDAQRQRMREAGVKNVEAFVAYQKGWQLAFDAHAKPGGDWVEALIGAKEAFARAVEIEPEFSHAWYAQADRYEHLLMAEGYDTEAQREAQQQAMRTLERAAQTSPDAQQRDMALAERQMLSDDWRGLAALIDAALKQPGCSAPNWMPVFAAPFGFAEALDDALSRATLCDPYNHISWGTRAWVAWATGRGQHSLDVQRAQADAIDRAGVPRATINRVRALLVLGQLDEARAQLAMVDRGVLGDVYSNARWVLARLEGERPESVRAELAQLNRSAAKLRRWKISDLVAAALGDEPAEANRLAAAMDAQPAGPFLLVLATVECQCGVPFDLAATPNLKARLAESGLPWPPAETLPFTGDSEHPAP